jgi:hypothetical protein
MRELIRALARLEGPVSGWFVKMSREGPSWPLFVRLGSMSKG